MTRQSEKVLEEALNLPPIERAEILEKLLASFEFSDRNAVDELWAIISIRMRFFFTALQKRSLSMLTPSFQANGS